MYSLNILQEITFPPSQNNHYYNDDYDGDDDNIEHRPKQQEEHDLIRFKFQNASGIIELLTLNIMNFLFISYT